MGADQNERAFQKQPTIPLNRKGGLKPSESRFMCNPGLGFKAPAEARVGNYIDKKCPFTGKVSIRGRILTGVVAKLKMNRTAVIRRDYANLLAHRDDNHLPVFKTRRSFLYENQQYQLDIYRAPCHSRCQGLVLLETFTTVPDDELMASLPPFLRVKRNTTGDPAFSMYNLSLRSDWADSADQFCHRLQLSSDDESDEEAVYDVKKASARLKAGTSESESSVESF